VARARGSCEHAGTLTRTLSDFSKDAHGFTKIHIVSQVSSKFIPAYIGVCRFPLLALQPPRCVGFMFFSLCVALIK